MHTVYQASFQTVIQHTEQLQHAAAHGYWPTSKHASCQCRK